MSSVLVTGGLGYVGSRACPLLLERGHHVLVVDLALYGEQGYQYLEQHPSWERDWQDRFEWIEGDLRSPETVKDAVRGIDTVLHLAAISNDPTGEIDDTLTRQVNFDAVGMLLALSREAGVKRFINASSSSVFGIKEESDVEETLEPEPLSSYSRYKMLSEWLVVAASAPDFCTVNIRPATICGVSPRQRFDLTVNKLTASAGSSEVGLPARLKTMPQPSNRWKRPTTEPAAACARCWTTRWRSCARSGAGSSSVLWPPR